MYDVTNSKLNYDRWLNKAFDQNDILFRDRKFFAKIC